MTTDATTTFDIGGDLTVNRLGYGAMQLPGPGVWGPSEDHDGALAVHHDAGESGRVDRDVLVRESYPIDTRR